MSSTIRSDIYTSFFRAVSFRSRYVLVGILRRKHFLALFEVGIINPFWLVKIEGYHDIFRISRYFKNIFTQMPNWSSLNVHHQEISVFINKHKEKVFMSIRLISKIFDMDFKKSALKFVLIALADNATDDGYCYPSIPRLSKKCSISERAVFRHIADLEKSAYLKHNCRTDKNGRTKSNEYWITLDNSVQDSIREGDNLSGGG